MFAFDGDYVFIEQTATYSLLDHRATKDNKKWGGARNPWNLTRTPGGSSGGDAALVAMRCVSRWRLVPTWRDPSVDRLPFVALLDSNPHR